MKRALVAGFALLALHVVPARSEIPEYPNTQITVQQWQAYLDAVKATPEVKCKEPDTFHLYCYSRPMKLEWIFTAAANPAHPALIQRKSDLGPTGIVITSRSYYAGSKRNYERWYRDYEVQNRRSEEYLAKEVEKARQYTPQDWETQAVQSMIYDMWAAREMGQFERTYSQLSSSMKTEISREQWKQRGQEFRQLAGPVKWRKITGTRWYRELPGTAQPGVYAEVSVTAAFENVAAYQGRLLFLQLNDGTFRLVKEEEKYGDALAASIPVVAEAAPAPAAAPAASPPKAPTPKPATPRPPAAAASGIPHDKGGKISEARFKEYLAAVRALPGVKCQRDNFKQLVCDSKAQSTRWVFTVAGHTAHPAVVQRRQVVKGGARTENTGHFAGSKEEFDIWFGTFDEMLDDETASALQPAQN